MIQHGYKLLGIPIADIRIAYIITASKVAGDLSYLERHKKAMRDMGLQFAEMDIESISQNDFAVVCADKNVIHIEGGNTFYLLRALRKTGFDKFVLDWIAQGKPYVGSSAGAYVACPTIEAALWDLKERDTFGVTDLTALGQVPFLLTVHYTDNEGVFIREKIKTASCPVRVLRDGQGLFVEGHRVTFVGGDTEVVL